MISTRRGGRAGSRSPRRSPASGSRFFADNVVNATGVWADRIRPDELLAEEEIPRIRPSRGTHHLSTATISRPARPPASSRRAQDRTIFALPWYGRVLVGTTDNDYEGEIDHRAAGGDDVEYLLEALNSYLRDEHRPAPT